MLSKELLEGLHDSFGSGSRILVTSRDRHVLSQVVDATYEVKALNDIEALQLFKSKAFKKIDPTSHHEVLLQRMVNYAKGNALALVVLGSALCDRSKEDWYSALNGLGQITKVQIQDVLKISYDGLNTEEQNIFLDVACFFIGMNRYTASKILEKKYSSVHYCISVLTDKSLISNSCNILEMHDLLREMAYSIGNQENEKPWKRSRLVDPEDMSFVLTKRKGTKAVKSICLDMSESREMDLQSDAFVGMKRLEFLIFKSNTSKVLLPQHGLEYLPNMLMYFRWDGYPSKSLPQNFCAENLFQFDFPHSKLEKLWSGQQNLVNLRRMDLSYSTSLSELQDLSMAKKLQYVKLAYCVSLIEVPSYFEDFERLGHLSVQGCYNLKCFPRRLKSNVIKCLSLRDCSNIKMSPEVSGNLQQLYMNNCKNLSRLPSSICKLRSLKKLHLSGCSKLECFPEIMEPMESLKELDLRDTAIRELSSIRLLKSLSSLHLDGTPIKELPELPPSLKVLTANDCESLQTMSSSTLGDSLSKLSFAECFKFDQEALMAEMQLKFQHGKINKNGFGMVLPGSEITGWFSDQSVGSSITIQFPSNPLKLRAIAFCLVVVNSSYPNDLYDDLYKPDDKYGLRWSWQAAKSNNGGDDDVIRSSYAFGFLTKSKIHESDHMYLCCCNIGRADFSKYFGHRITFEFNPSVIPDRKLIDINPIKKIYKLLIRRHLNVRRCGVRLLFDENPYQPSISD